MQITFTMESVLWTVLCVFLAHREFVVGDFPCICSYNDQTCVYADPDTESRCLGKLDMFDCKPNYPYQSAMPMFYTVIFKRQVGFVLNDNNNIREQACTGNPPPIDIEASTTSTSTGSSVGTPLFVNTMTASTTTTIEPVTITHILTTILKPTTVQLILTTPVKPVETTLTQLTPVTILNPTTTTGISDPTTPAKQEQTTQLSTTLLVTSEATSSPTITSTAMTNSTVMSTTIETTGCHDGWFAFHSMCYFVQMDQSKSLTWEQAQNECSTHHSHLVFIESEEEQYFLSLLLQHVFLNVSVSDLNLWAGATDSRHEHSWKWTVPQYQTIGMGHFNAWANGSPEENLQHNCLALRGDNNFMWKDENCNNSQRYICEKSRNIDDAFLVG